MNECNFINTPPNKRISPFDTVDGDNYFIYSNEEFSYLGNYEEIGSIKTPYEDRLFGFRGYVIGVYKRHSVIENGEIIYTNPNFNDGLRSPKDLDGKDKPCYIILTNKVLKYKVDSWGDQLLRTCSLSKEDGSYNCTLKSLTFDNTQEAIAHCLWVSHFKEGTYIVAEVFTSVDKHQGR